MDACYQCYVTEKVMIENDMVNNQGRPLAQQVLANEKGIEK